MRRIRITIAAVECVGILSNPACRVHAPHYTVTRGLSGNIITRLKNIFEHKMCFDFPCKFSLKHSSFLEEFSEMAL